MRRRPAILVGLFLVAASAVALRGEPWARLRAAPQSPATDRTVYVVGDGVAEADLIALGAAVAGGNRPACCCSTRRGRRRS